MNKKNNNTIKAKDIEAVGVYQTKNQTIYWCFIDKNAYILTDRTASQFARWQIIYFMPVLCAVVLILFQFNFFISLLIGVLVFIALFLLFYKSFVEKLPLSSKFVKPVDESYFIRKAKSKTYYELKAMMITPILIILLIVIFGFLVKIDIYVKYILYCIGIILLVIEILILYTYYIKKKNNY